MKPSKNHKRLAARRAASNRDEAFTLPGSLNPHKSFPQGNGHRSKSKIKADSRAATN